MLGIMVSIIFLNSSIPLSLSTLDLLSMSFINWHFFFLPEITFCSLVHSGFFFSFLLVPFQQIPLCGFSFTLSHCPLDLFWNCWRAEDLELHFSSVSCHFYHVFLFYFVFCVYASRFFLRQYSLTWKYHKIKGDSLGKWERTWIEQNKYKDKKPKQKSLPDIKRKTNKAKRANKQTKEKNKIPLVSTVPW